MAGPSRRASGHPLLGGKAGPAPTTIIRPPPRPALEQRNGEAGMVEEVVTHGEAPPAALSPPHAMAELVTKKLRFVGLMTMVYMVSYVGLTILAGFAREILSASAIG